MLVKPTARFLRTSRRILPSVVRGATGVKYWCSTATTSLHSRTIAVLDQRGIADRFFTPAADRLAKSRQTTPA
jgi:hypothetical protein